MNMDKYFNIENEKPLDNTVPDGGLCGILRTIACIGDSLSSGEFESLDENGKVGWHDYYEYSWGQFIARHIGSKVYNFSKGGMTAKEYCEGFGEQKDLWNEKYKCQAYIMAMGVNDISWALDKSSGYGFGDISDIDLNDYRNNKPTFMGYYAQIIQRYKQMQPKARFFLMTIPKSPSESEERNELAEKHREFLYKLCEMFDYTYVLDIRQYGPVYDEQFRKAFYLAGHLNAAGYVFTARMVESYIDYIIRHNPDDFRQIGFVGSPYYNSKEKW